MRTVAPYSDQAAVWVDLVAHFEWKTVVFMHSSDEEGRALLGRFQNFADGRGIEVYLFLKLQYTQMTKYSFLMCSFGINFYTYLVLQIEKNIQYMAGLDDYTTELSEINDVQSKVILLYAS